MAAGHGSQDEQRVTSASRCDERADGLFVAGFELSGVLFDQRTSGALDEEIEEHDAEYAGADKQERNQEPDQPLDEVHHQNGLHRAPAVYRLLAAVRPTGPPPRSDSESMHQPERGAMDTHFRGAVLVVIPSLD